MSDQASGPAEPAPLQRYRTLQTALNLLEQGLSIFDGELRLVAWNRAFVRLLDFPDAMAHPGAPFESFIRFNAARGEYGPGDPDAQVAERLAAARTFTAHEIERTRPDGSILRIRGCPVPGHGFVTLYTDVTAQRRAERIVREQNLELESRVAARTAELQRSEQRVRLMMDSIPALVAYFDSRRVYRYLNRGYRDWFQVDTTRPASASAREFLGAEVYERVRPNVRRALGGETVNFEYELKTRAGRRLDVRTSLVPQLGGDGSVIGCFELTFDITDERRSQELIARAEKLESLGQMTGGLAHDFNNILTVVICNLEALADAKAGDPLVGDFVQPALEASWRGAELIRGLLSFARRQPLRSAAVDVAPLIAGVATLVRPTLPADLSLRIDTGAAALWTWIDAAGLEQALLNLIFNARDATAPDGRIELRARRLHLDAAAAAALQLSAGDYVRIDVDDNGCGMDSPTVARLFEPFFTTKRPGQGTGLGMAVVYGFIKQSGGAIDVRSAPGRGTTLSLWLPAAPGVAAGAQPAASAQVAAARRLALLVDDDAQARRAARRSLMELGYAVLEAESGAEALQLLAQTEDIGLLLAAADMPGDVDGLALARAACDQRRALAVVLTSGASDQPPRQPGAARLTKPFTVAELAEAIRDGQSS